MKRSSVFLLALAAVLLAGGSTSLRAQDPGATRPDRPMFARNPVAVLVDRAQVLRLSGDPTTPVRSRAQGRDARNREPLDSLERYRPQGGGGGGGMGMGMGRGEMTPEQRE